MAKARDILGMNARTLSFIRPENKRPYIFRIDNKIQTKRLLEKAQLPTPKVYQVFEIGKDVDNFDFRKLPASFVIKPTRGFGGSGILVVYGKKKDTWIDNEGEEVTIEVPAKFETCYVCRGKGKHVNPSIDAHGITQEEFYEDPDFAEQYWMGDYDVVCNECHGQRVIPVLNEDVVDPEHLKMIREYEQGEADYQAMVEAERRYGC